MKNLLILLGLGIAGTAVLYFTPNQEPIVEGSNFKTIKYTGVNNKAIETLKSQINQMAKVAIASRPTHAPELVQSIEGVKEFTDKLDGVFNYLKSTQLLYRYEFQKSFIRTRDQLANLSFDNVEDLNAKINNLVDYHLAIVSQLKTTTTVKNKLTLMLNDIRTPFKIVKTADSSSKSTSGEAISNLDMTKLLKTVSEIKKPSSVTMEFHLPETTTSQAPIFVLWGVLLAVAALFWKREKVATSETNRDNSQVDINPTLKKIMSEVDYPIFVCDASFNVTWQNNVSKKFNFNQEIIQSFIAHKGSHPTESVDIQGSSFNLQFSELNYKNGKKNLFVQLKPVTVASKYMEHLVDAKEVELLLENSKDLEGGFKDFNQTVAELAIKMNYLFKVSGKFLDIDFKKDIADCFVENSRLEMMCREFILSCHFIIKDKDQVSGIYMRTDELGQRFALGCFLPGLSEHDLTNGLLARDFLKKFSILEAKYSICLPTIDIKPVTAGEVKGVDVILSFENRSQMESLLNQSFATM